MRNLATILLLILTTIAVADGLPVVDGKVDAEHTILTLSESQTEEVEVLGTLTLTDAQWNQMRKIGPACPKRFNTIFPVDHHDCTCGDYEYVILMSRKKAAILHDSISEDPSAALRDLFAPRPPDGKPQILGGSRWDTLNRSLLTIHVDHKGRYHLEGSRIPYPLLLSLLQIPQAPPVATDSAAGAQFKRSISFALAAGARSTPTINEQVLELKQTATTAGWDAYLAWIIRPE